MKKNFKKLALFIGIILLLAGGYAGYAILSYSRLPDYLELKATAAPEAAAPYETARLPTKYYENSGVLNLSRPQPIL